MSHTPGPWRFEVTSDGWDGKTCQLVGGDDDLILGGWGYDACGIIFGQATAKTKIEDEPLLPDARLIVAAPDLLAAAKAALNDRMYKDWPRVADILIAAIAKAEGR